MRFTVSQVAVALLAALLWMAIGLWQRGRDGVPLQEGVVAELPLSLLVFVLALLWSRLRRR